jgi:hypothetical protein
MVPVDCRRLGHQAAGKDARVQLNPLIRLPGTDIVDPAEFLAAYPALAPAIDRARAKIQAKARAEADILASNLKIILRDWAEERQISLIAWAGVMDLVPVDFGIDLLSARLAERLGEIRFEQFLQNFADQLIELDRAERRSG